MPPLPLPFHFIISIVAVLVFVVVAATAAASTAVAALLSVIFDFKGRYNARYRLNSWPDKNEKKKKNCCSIKIETVNVRFYSIRHWKIVLITVWNKKFLDKKNLYLNLGEAQLRHHHLLLPKFDRPYLVE